MLAGAAPGGTERHAVPDAPALRGDERGGGCGGGERHLLGHPHGDTAFGSGLLNVEPPVQLSALAPLVSAAYHDGDPQARSIVERAAAALLATVGRVREEGEGTPIVLAGSLTLDTPVGATLRTLLSARFSGPILPARTGVGGAAWLALAALDPALATPATHSRLCR